MTRWFRLRLTSVSGFPRLWRNIRRPCSVSTPRSSNRTGGFPASGSRTRISVTPRVSRLGTRKPCDSKAFFAVACNALHNAWASSGGRLSPIARPFVASCVVLELRPLCSASVTRLHRSYGPLRHPTRPGLVPHGSPVGGHAPPPLGLPVLRWSPLANMPSPLPRWTGGGYRSPDSHRGGLPRKIAGSASTFCCFEACSAFTFVTACLLAESP